MSNTPLVIPDLVARAGIPSEGILSRTLVADDRVKVVLFGFAAGEELSAHTAPMPAIIHLVSGRIRLTLGTVVHELGPGAWVHLPARLTHAVLALEPASLLLTLIRPAPDPRADTTPS